MKMQKDIWCNELINSLFYRDIEFCNVVFAIGVEIKNKYKIVRSDNYRYKTI